MSIPLPTFDSTVTKLASLGFIKIPREVKVSSKIERSHNSTCDGQSIPVLDLVNLHEERKHFIIEEFRNPSKD
jgi:hypothetical protein